MSDERRHAATPQRRRRAQDQGQGARSQDLVAAAAVLALVGSLSWWGQGLTAYLCDLSRAGLGGATTSAMTADELVESWRRMSFQAARVTVPVLALIVLAVGATQFAQSGFVFSPRGWRISPPDPLGRMANMISFTSISRAALGVAKLVAVVTIVGWSLWGEREALIALSDLEAGTLAGQIGDLVLAIVTRVAFGLLLLALLDYGYQRWKLERDLRMSDQELREEMRSTEGDPQLASRRRDLQRQRLSGDPYSGLAASRSEYAIGSVAQVDASAAYPKRVK